MSEKLLTKEEFLTWLQANYKAWAGDSARTQEGWLFSLESFAKEMNRGK